MGKQTPTGTMFLREDLSVLLEEGHELGCHTFGHCNAWETKPDAFEDSVIENRRKLNDLMPGAAFKTLSYPISVPRPFTKRRVAKHFGCCRCGGQTFNVGTTDLNYMAAYFLEQSRGNFEEVQSLIEENRKAKGWLIFATHDISDDPTPYGCRPEFFQSVVRCALTSGASILPVVQVLEALRSPTP
jgi:hypothetical protein